MMSAGDWVQAAKIEEQRLLDEIAKTILYRQLEAVRAVIAVYEGTAEPLDTPDTHEAGVVSTQSNGPVTQRFKKANAFSDRSDAAGDASSRSRPQ